MDHCEELDSSQLAGGEAALRSGKRPDLLRAGFVQIAFCDVGGVKIYQCLSRPSET